MRSNKFPDGFTALCAILAITLLVAATAATAHAQATEKVIYGFPNATDGAIPKASLIFDAAGNLYGTTVLGGTYDCGTVFELSPQSGGGWTGQVLHSFFKNSKDGCEPFAGVTMDASGNLYGTTNIGGADACGTVFELSPQSGGRWAERLLHTFKSGKDGCMPYAGVILDASGNLYGTTDDGGTNTGGIVFELSPTTGGAYSEKILHTFSDNGIDGFAPRGGLTLDSAGNLYGTTYYGGAYINGSVFELKHTASGSWGEKILSSFYEFSFGPQNPSCTLIFDTAGNLYGTTYQGGAYNAGTAFELSPATGGTWNWTILHSFNNNGVDGAFPSAGLVLDHSGNLYGTTINGGTDTGGAAFELTPAGGGAWTETVLHSFGQAGDGFYPDASLILDSAGNLYGTVELGDEGNGTVFEITP